MALSSKQRSFVEHFLQCFSGAEAARRAGYSGDRAKVTGSELQRSPEVAAEIARGIALRLMSADEALLHETEIARGTYAEFLRSDGSFDFAAAKEEGKLHLVKSVAETKFGLKVEFQDRQAALQTILRAHGRLTDKQEHSGTIDLQVVGYEIVPPVAANEGVKLNTFIAGSPLEVGPVSS